MQEIEQVRLTLPDHLVERIRGVLAPDVARHIEASLRNELESAFEAHRASSSASGNDQVVVDVAHDGQETVVPGSRERGETEETVRERAEETSGDPPIPPTVSEEALEKLARWTGTKYGRGVLKRNRLGM